MLRSKTWHKDYHGALLLFALGAGVLGLGIGYKIGELNRMGAGFVPVVLGALLIACAIAIAVTAGGAGAATSTAALPSTHAHDKPEWRGWACILGGVCAFVVLGQYGGLLPASFACVFIAAQGDRNCTVKGSALLATGLTLFGLLVFHYGLKLQLPLFQWG